MRAIRKLKIQMSLVSVDVSLFKPVDEHRTHTWHQYHLHEDGTEPGRVKQKRFCADCDTEVDYSSIAKGAEVGEQVVIINQADLDAVEKDEIHGITVEQFIPADSVPRSMLRDSYYVAPQDKSGVRSFALLRQAIADSGKVALVRYSLRNDIAWLGILYAEGDILMMQNICWPEDLRQPDFKLLDTPVELSEKEVAMAGMLIESMSGEFEPSDWKDTYQERVAAMVEAKANGDRKSVV